MFTYESLVRNPLGAFYQENKGTQFQVWAPNAKNKVQLHCLRRPPSPRSTQVYTMSAVNDLGYFSVLIPETLPGDQYFFSLNDSQELLPDPASRFQPEGVRGPSAIISHEFPWEDQSWKGVSKEDLVFYELHVGTFTLEGTFSAIHSYLPYLRDLGITALELMPVAQFPGTRNWGYDGVFPFAVQNSYGGPIELKHLINACHQQGIGVFLDVVYNHLGPEGNILAKFGPYFQSRYHTPWGKAINFDGPYSDEVKKYFCYNLVQWLEEFHFDGLRLDAVHAICDSSQHPFLRYLGEIKRALEIKLQRPFYLIAESDLNEPRLLEEVEKNGFQLDLQWNDDFHHSLHVELTHERNGYYQDFNGFQSLVRAFEKNVVYQDDYSHFRKASRGREFKGISKTSFIVYSQNHDQIGNRPLGERLQQIVGITQQRLAAACLFLSPYTPLIFMGEEAAESKPFLYFVDHQDKDLIKAIRKGRVEEFKDFFSGDFLLNATIKNPDELSTFQQCQLDLNFNNFDPIKEKQFKYYQTLIGVSKWLRQEKVFSEEHFKVTAYEKEKILQLSGRHGSHAIVVLFSFQAHNQKLPEPFWEHKKYKILFPVPHPELLQNSIDLKEFYLPSFTALLLEGDD